MLGAIVSFAHDQLQRKKKVSVITEVVCREWGKHMTRACLTFSCSICSGFSSLSTVRGGGEGLMMMDICREDMDGRVNSRKPQSQDQHPVVA